MELNEFFHYDNEQKSGRVYIAVENEISINLNNISGSGVDQVIFYKFVTLFDFNSYSGKILISK